MRYVAAPRRRTMFVTGSCMRLEKSVKIPVSVYPQMYVPSFQNLPAFKSTPHNHSMRGTLSPPAAPCPRELLPGELQSHRNFLKNALLALGISKAQCRSYLQTLGLNVGGWDYEMTNGALIAVALMVLFSPRVWMICPQKAGCGSVCGKRFAPYASGIGP